MPPWTAGSVTALKPTRVFGPNVKVRGTSAASRPRAIKIRPMRGSLLRGSKVCHRPQKDLDLRRKVHWGIGRRKPNVADVAGAVAGRDIHATAQRERQMGVVA